jgi:formate hydrogenlyase subunit 6/NADH:ubiquinone oxidoreductase subunit I
MREVEMSTDAPAAAVIAPEVVDDLVGALAARGYRVIGPTVRDGAIVLDEVRGRSDLPVGWGDRQEAGTYRLVPRDDQALFGYALGPQSPRRFLDPPRRRVLSVHRRDGRLHFDEEPPPEVRYAFLAVRACEVAALRIQDRVFHEGAAADPSYRTARAASFVVAVNCGAPAATCFCTSTGTGPAVETGHDLALTEILEPPHRLLAEPGTDRGREVLAELAGRPATAADVAAARAVVAHSADTMTRQLDPVAARDTLAANLEHPHWDDVATRCLSCANCTLVCPTCFCSTVEDVAALDGEHAERVQRWDSCFTMDHSYLHGVGAVRADTRSRYRQWLTHKLSTWWDQFGTSGCVGCGRCIAWCPARIDLTAEVRAIAGADGKDDDR